MRLLRAALKEPVTHFFLVSLLIFAINNLTSSEQKEKIVVTTQVRDYLVNTRQELQLKTLTDAEADNVVEAYIKEEMLYREAYKRNLDKSDSRMRRDMIRKIRGILESKVPEPTEQDLRQFFKDNPDQFLKPATFTLHQVYFKEFAEIPNGLKEELNSHQDFLHLGDTIMGFSPIIKNATSQIIVRSFGVEAAQAVTNIELNQWTDPIQSQYGYHLFKVDARFPASTWTYDDVATNIHFLWRNAKLDELTENELQEIENNYEVVYEYRATQR